LGEKMQIMNQSISIINAEGLILGRMASIIAKRLLRGEKIIIVNAEKAVISGKRKTKIRAAKIFLEVGHPKKGPFHYRRPDRIVRKTVRGMLPYKKPRGKYSYKRLKVFIGIPNELKEQRMETLKDASANKLTCSFFTLNQLAKEIGYSFGV
jgi:large subunit ribosomal protein L13